MKVSLPPVSSHTSFSRLSELQLKHLIRHTSPDDTMHLIRRYALQLCEDPRRLTQLIQNAPEDRQNDLVLAFMKSLQAKHKGRLTPLLQYNNLPDPLLKALAVFFTDTTTISISDALSSDWQTVFTHIPQAMLDKNGSCLAREHNLAALLTCLKESQRMPLLRTLFDRFDSCLWQLFEQEESLHNVLQLLTEPQRLELLLLKDSLDRSMSRSVSDKLWPVIRLLLKPEDMVTILQQELNSMYPEIKNNLVTSVSSEELWRIWQDLPQTRRSTLLKGSAFMAPLLSHLPSSVQQPIREQFLSQGKYQMIETPVNLKPWLQNERYFSTLFPAASHWLNESGAMQNLSFHEQLQTLTTESDILHALLDHIAQDERNLLIPWIISSNTVTIGVLNSLLDRYTNACHPCLTYLKKGDWMNWTEKMPQILAILERLPKSDRPQFIQILGCREQPWKPENHQLVRHACTLFDIPVEEFVARTGLRKTVSFTPLMQAVHDNDIDMAKEQLSSLNEQDLLGRTALMHAWLEGNPGMATFLAEQPGCDLNISTLHNETVFACVAQTGNIAALQRLLKTGRCQPTPQDALKALCFAQKNKALLQFLFENVLPQVAWQQTPPSLHNCSFSYSKRDRYLHDVTFQECYDTATLPCALLSKYLPELTLNLRSVVMFRYQMQALKIDALQASNLAYLLQALTATKRVPSVLKLSGFHISDSDRPALLEFIKSNPRLKRLSFKVVDLHQEDQQAFVDDLNRLELEHKPKIKFVCSSGTTHRLFKPAATTSAPWFQFDTMPRFGGLAQPVWSWR